MVRHPTVLTWDLCSLSCKIGLCVTGESAWNIKSEKQLCIPSLLDPMSPPMLAMQIPISSQYDPNWSWNPTLKISMVPNMSTIHPAFQRVSQFVFWIEKYRYPPDSPVVEVAVSSQMMDNSKWKPNRNRICISKFCKLFVAEVSNVPIYSRTEWITF